METQTLLIRWDRYIFNRYMGRAPSTVQEGHYITKGISEKDLQAAFLKGVVNRLTEFLNGALAERQKGEKKGEVRNVVDLPRKVLQSKPTDVIGFS